MRDFHTLTPDRVMNLVEDVLGEPVDPVCRPLTSYINRVYEVQLASGGAVVVKFYRPGRWTVEALQEEHDFVFDLQEAEVPVVAPLLDSGGYSLFEESPGLWCAVLPRRRGRPFEDLDPAAWQELGRTLARMHAAGDREVPEHRLVWHPDEASETHLDTILDHLEPFSELCHRYEDTAAELIDAIAPVIDESDFTRIHGDMHPANLMRRPGTKGLWLIDFDDMVLGPPVQDVWMLLPEAPEDCPRELENLLHGYGQMRPISRETLRWIEPLRAMRFLHFTAWCALQQADHPSHQPGDPRLESWWRQQLASLTEQRQRIREELSI